MKSKIKLAFAVAFTMALFGCAGRTIFNQEILFGPGGWDKENPALFKVNITDTAQVIDVGFTFKHRHDYPYNNLWLFLSVTDPDGQVQTDTLELFLARVDGEWHGRQKRGNVEVSAMFMQGVKMNKSGQYLFKVVQGMRREVLPGMISMEIWLQESDF